MHIKKRRPTPHPAKGRKRIVPTWNGIHNRAHIPNTRVKFSNVYFNPTKQRAKRVYANLIGAAWPLVGICYQSKHTYTPIQHRRLATQVIRTYILNKPKYAKWRLAQASNQFYTYQFQAFESVVEDTTDGERSMVFNF